MKKMTYNEIVRFHNRFPNLEIEGYNLKICGPKVGINHEKFKKREFQIETEWVEFMDHVTEIEYDICAYAVEVPEALDREMEFGEVKLKTTGVINNIKMKTDCPPEFAINYIHRIYDREPVRKADCAKDMIIDTKKYGLHLYNAMIVDLNELDDFGNCEIGIIIDYFEINHY